MRVFNGRLVAPTRPPSQALEVCMDREEQKRIAREQRAGYAALRQFEIEEMRKATFEDRLAAFRRVLSLSEHLPKNESRADDEEVLHRWKRIRTNYAARSR